MLIRIWLSFNTFVCEVWIRVWLHQHIRDAGDDRGGGRHYYHYPLVHRENIWQAENIWDDPWLGPCYHSGQNLSIYVIWHVWGDCWTCSYSWTLCWCCWCCYENNWFIIEDQLKWWVAAIFSTWECHTLNMFPASLSHLCKNNACRRNTETILPLKI